MMCKCCDELEMPDNLLTQNMMGEWLCASCHIWSHYEMKFLAFKDNYRPMVRVYEDMHARAKLEWSF